MDFFNNLDANLPGGFRTRYDESVLDGHLFVDDPSASSRMRERSTRDFFEDCRLAMEKVGISESQLNDIRHRFDQNMGDEEIAKEFTDTLLPIYINLRLMGYKHYPDLIG